MKFCVKRKVEKRELVRVVHNAYLSTKEYTGYTEEFIHMYTFFCG